MGGYPVNTSAQRKLARSVEQVKALQSEAEAFIDSRAYVFDIDN